MSSREGTAAATFPEVDVVILTWNDGELLEKAITSALHSSGVRVTVYVIDNGSEPPAEVGSDSRVHLVRNEENVGVSGGRNQGVALGTSPLVCLLDSDAELAPNSIAALIAPLSDPSIGVTVPVFVGQMPEASAGRAPSLRVKIERGLNRRTTYEPMHQPESSAPFWDVEFGIGACQVFRRSVFEDVGGLDATIFFGPEDVDFCLRVADAGNRVVQVDDADVLHPPRRAFRKPLSRRGIRHAAALVAHFWRHRGRGKSRHLSEWVAGTSGEPGHG